MWLKFYTEGGTLNFVINSDKISGMWADKDPATQKRRTKIYFEEPNDYMIVKKPIEEIMEMIENGEEQCHPLEIEKRYKKIVEIMKSPNCTSQEALDEIAEVIRE